MLPASPTPDFRSPAFLRAHIADTMAFYEGRCIDPSGGLFQFFKDDGSVYDARTRHLVSSTRYVFTHAMGWRHIGKPQWQATTRHALTFVDRVHAQPNGGFAWVLDWHDGQATVTDSTNHCYGLAFVLLAHAHALMAGVAEAADGLERCWQLMERRFWRPEHALYADEATPDWTVGPYRGQNANMHACEAMLAAFDATAEMRYLERAATLAHNITMRLAALADGLIWEHYRADWSVDWDYNRNDKTNIFRPWGYQPGHLTEWAKLLLILERHRALSKTDSGWLVPRAVELFDAALEHAWDYEHGGIYYGFAPDRSVCDDDKYFWVQAESLAAAALLALATRRAHYWDWYDRIWRYSWKHFVDHRFGAWYRILARDNRKYSDEKSPAGKTDYHTMGACYEVLNALERDAGSQA
jgi:mannose/cellobiose epimerase-like protein (N-acyl-D-glucosamine 2-epimerase family)